MAARRAARQARYAGRREQRQQEAFGERHLPSAVADEFEAGGGGHLDARRNLVQEAREGGIGARFDATARANDEKYRAFNEDPDPTHARYFNHGAGENPWGAASLPSNDAQVALRRIEQDFDPYRQAKSRFETARDTMRGGEAEDPMAARADMRDARHDMRGERQLAMGAERQQMSQEEYARNRPQQYARRLARTGRDGGR